MTGKQNMALIVRQEAPPPNITPVVKCLCLPMTEHKGDCDDQWIQRAGGKMERFFKMLLRNSLRY